ncbi:Para-hydroxybenzoate--polyprenyltransferase, mitochondrial precursor (PHB:polyprenyltransferase) [Tulasnella sp. 403]|nr:Para-hydroxybenzoate--polyprenyltransferase, mitochondrial precursor (PHB:polyprenyltransferase) [Tulasnella sp. 403]
MAIANLPFQIAYPLIKRFSYWTSAFLGITFGWGSLIGWSAMTGSLTWEINAPLYAAGVCWAFGYDTLYAFMVHSLYQPPDVPAAKFPKYLI